MSKYLSAEYLMISSKTGTLVWAVQQIHFLGVPERVVTPNYVKLVVSLNIRWYQKTMPPEVKPFKELIFGGVHMRVPGGWHPQTMLTYLSVKYLLISKKHWHHSWSGSRNWFLGGPFGGFLGVWHSQTMPKYLSAKYLLISKTLAP